MSLPERWDCWLAELRDRGRYRTLSAPAGIDFSSNDYLGYAGEGGELPGAGGVSPTSSRALGGLTPPAPNESSPTQFSGTSSRLLRGHNFIWDQVETALAHWHVAEAALVMNSGYVANEGLLSSIIEPDDWVASDQFNHASIIDGLRLSRAQKFIYHHQDLNQLEAGLRSAPRHAGRELFIVTESLFGMEGDVTPLTEIAALAERHGAHLIVDEAHATGCFGPAGSGLVDAAGLRPRVLATVHTGGKALGVLGAYMCGSQQLRELLINRCRHLIFTTALPAVVGFAWLTALERVKHDDAGRARLHANADRFRDAVARHGHRAGGAAYIVPLIIGDDAMALRSAVQLQERGYDVRAIRPPSVPPGTARLRVSVHADHDTTTLSELACAICEVLGES